MRPPHPLNAEQQQLMDRLHAEMDELERNGIMLTFDLAPMEAWMLLSSLQLALRHPAMVADRDTVGRWVRGFAEDIEQRLCAGRPAMAEAVRQGWDREHDLTRVIGNILLELVNPVTLEIALTVQHELQSRLDESDRLRRQHVERARYEAELAQRRYMRVDPENRLVADSLEADWNEKLRALADAQQEYEQRRDRDRRLFDGEQRSSVLALAQDFPRLWKDPATEDRDRKRMIRLLVEDVTMIRGEQIRLHFRFRGGATKTVVLPNPLRIWETWMTDSEVVSRIDRLLDTYTFGEIASTLNDSGFKPGRGKRFTARYIARIQKQYSLRSRFDRLRKRGMLTLDEMASTLSVNPKTVKIWASHGLLQAHAYTDKPEHLYEPPGRDAPRKAQGMKLSLRRPVSSVMPECSNEVQYEA